MRRNQHVMITVGVSPTAWALATLQNLTWLYFSQEYIFKLWVPATWFSHASALSPAAHALTTVPLRQRSLDTGLSHCWPCPVTALSGKTRMVSQSPRQGIRQHRLHCLQPETKKSIKSLKISTKKRGKDDLLENNMVKFHPLHSNKVQLYALQFFSWLRGTVSIKPQPNLNTFIANLH